MKKEKVIEYIGEKMCTHKAEYLTMEAVRQYRELASILPDTYGRDIGLRRALREAFMEKYGLTELESFNLLNGLHTQDCLNLYYCIKKCDEARNLIWKELQRNWIPDEISDRQIDALLNVMVRRKNDSKLIEIIESADQITCVGMFLKEIFEKKESKRTSNQGSNPDQERE